MSEKRFDFSLGACKIYDKEEERLLEDTEVCGLLNEMFEKLYKKQEKSVELFFKYQNLQEENEELRNELQFFDKIINFFASNPMTKYSSKAELLEEMKLLEKMGLI